MSDLPDFTGATPARPAAVTIGVFDGVHRGHLGLLAQLRSAAAARELATAVVTFKNHPLTVLRPEIDVTYLMPFERRLALLEAADVDHVVPIEFTQAISQLTAREFVTALRDRLSMRHLVAGPDFALGKGRAGTLDVLRDLGGELGFEVTEADPSVAGGVRVSSTETRRRLTEGAVGEAAELLGRPFRLTGEVVKGDQRGRALGFPTANLKIAPQMALPADGIYATLAHVGERVLPSATNVGVLPTFEVSGRTVETFILDFDEDLYGAEVSIDFIERIRPEAQFDSVEALIEQMDRDVEQARGILAAEARR